MSTPRKRKMVGQRVKATRKPKDDETLAMEEWIGKIFDRKDFSSDY